MTHPLHYSFSIDNLVESFETKLVNNEELKSYTYNITVYEYLIATEPKLVLATLQCGTNKPSVHDLFLIDACKDQPKIRTTLTEDHWKKIKGEIIQFYKERK